MPPDRVSFVVVGKPEPAGSKRAFPIKRAGGGMGVSVVDANKKAKPWQAAVAAAGYSAMLHANGLGIGAVLADPAPELSLFEGPLGLAIIFTLRRPKGHFGIHGVRAGAPAFPITRPDCTKLIRGVEDALTGVVWRDDSQVVEQCVTKRYGEPEGANIVVFKL